MDIDVEGLRADLRSVRQRRAARDPALPHRIGPRLRQVLEVTELHDPCYVIDQLHRLIEQRLGNQPEEVRVALRVAFGLHPGADQAEYQRRLEWLAGKWHVSERTARREVDRATDLLVQAVVTAARASASRDPGFVVEALASALTFTGDQVRIFERRGIRATRRLATIRWAYGLPRQVDQLRFQVNGAAQCHDIQQRGGAVEPCVALDRPLEPNQRHEFAVSYTLPASLVLEPHYVLQPDTPYQRFDLTVAFDPLRIPAQVWRVDGALHREIDCCPSNGTLLEPDGSARVHAGFDRIDLGRSYGIAWSRP